MWKSWFNILNSIINISLVAIAFYLGVFNQEYDHASFLLLLVVLNQNKAF